MLEGLEISEEKFLKLNSERRINAEYFQKKYLDEDESISKYLTKNIGEIAYVTDGQHGYHEIDNDSNIHLLTAKNAKNWFANLDGAEPLAQWVDDNNRRSSLQENDIILSTRGTVGLAALVKKDVLPANIDQDVARIHLNEDIIPEYVIAYLNSKFGQHWMMRNQTGMVQQGLSLEKVRELPLPILSMPQQKTISTIIISAYSHRQESSQLYEEAETILLTDLGFKDWRPEKKSYNIKQLKESFLASGRLDAEYYQPKYDDLFETLSYYRCNTISEIATIKKSIEPGSDAYCDSGVPFVRVSDITKFGISEPAIYLSRSDYNVSELHPKKDTILLSKDGSVGIAYKVTENMDCITSGALLHLNVYNQDYLPNYVTLVLNSIIVRMQAERDSSGAIIQHWKPSEIERVVIPYLPKETQCTIADKVQQSFALRAESERLLAEAKLLVESEIQKID